MSAEKVLFIEDEPALAEIVKESLEAKGFEVCHAPTVSRAMLLYRQHNPDIIIADVMLPDGSGFDFIQELRKADAYTPVIFLTSRSQTDDVVKGFELGGNDYLKKPFSIAELVVRMKSLLRKENSAVIRSAEARVWVFGAFRFHYPAGELLYGKQKKQLTSREADLLQLLLLNRNEALQRNYLLQTLWGNTDYFSGRSLDVFISKIRKYLSTDSSVKIINVRGIGYKMIY
ncbi:response regulator transcription factor [Terrimonas rubra]|uniref:Response regulator transcription factor n=1 Tax=Terrimonas rubra TaxID=1035890 RepID=A0ABW6A119_9BACT